MGPNSKLTGERGVYVIRNTINDNCYIGRTSCFYKRCHQYVAAFKVQNKRQLNPYLLNAMNKYGFDKFSFEPLEFCSSEVVKARELYWIKKLGTYNLRIDSEGHCVTHPETRQKISARLRYEWSTGKRNGHSAKLKTAWAYRDREAQADLFSKTLTKYQYKVGAEILTYRELKDRKLHGVLSNFHRTKKNIATFRGVAISREVLI